MRRSTPNLTMEEFAVEQTPQSSIAIAARDELARDLGYQSIREMMEQTEAVPLPSGLYMHLTTDSDGYWVTWSDRPHYGLQRFDSRQKALTELRDSVDPILIQS